MMFNVRKTKTKLEILEELEIKVPEAEESHSEAMNSYGAGYDTGYVAALRWVLYGEEE